MLSWLKKNFFDPIDFSGSKNVGFHSHSVSGDQAAFAQQNYFGDGDQAITDRTDLLINGNKVFGVLNFETRITNNRFGNPYDRRMTLVYDSKFFDTRIGDITGSLHNTNPLAGFSKTMSGAMGTFKFGRGFELKLVGSDTKATARTIAINGNNSTGPYYLPGGNIVDGTLHVRVNDVDKALGANYTVDYQTGILNFVDGTVVPPTSTIQATYESYGFNDQNGTVYGASLLLPLAGSLSMELTGIEQKQKGGSGLSTRTEKFYGYGPPATPYDLQFEPLIDPAHPFVLTVDNVPQAMDIDYYFDAYLPFRFYFKRFVPATSIVQAIYTPKPSPGSQTNGNKRIYGVSLRWAPVKGLSFQQNFASSTLDATGGVVKGTAKSTQVSYKFGRLNLRIGLTDIPSTYTNVSSTGFNRNENGQTYDVGYDFGRNFAVKAGRTHSTIASPTYNQDGSVTANNADTQTDNLTLAYAPKAGWSLNLSHVKTSFDSPTGTTSNTADSLRYAKKFGRINTSLEFSRFQIHQATFVNGGTTDDSMINSARLTTSWEANRWLTFGSGISQNSISGSQGSSSGRDISLDVTVHPSDSMQAKLSFNDSNSGYYNYSGFGSGYGYGLGSGGFSGGSGTYQGQGYGVKQRGYNLNVHYLPWAPLALDLTYSRQFASGENLSNSDLSTVSLGFGYQASGLLRLSGTVSKQNVAFVSSSGSSDTTILGFAVNAGPWRRLSLTFDFQRMLTGSQYTGSDNGFSNYSQNLNTIAGRLTYAISGRQRAFVDGRTGATLGYLASDDSNYGVGYEYDISKFITLVGSYRIRNLVNHDATNSAYSYSSRSFDLDFSIHF